MRGLEVEARSGARSQRAGPNRAKKIPREQSSQSRRTLKPVKPKSIQQSTSVRRSKDHSKDHRPRQRNRTRDRIDFDERKRRALDDIATYRVVSVRDLVEQRFGGNAFAARKGIDALKQDGFLEEHTVRVKSGKTFRVLTATNKGRRKAWGSRKHNQQRYWDGLAKPSEIRHDATVYRAARNEIAKLEKAGSTVKRIQLDYEMKGRVSKVTEQARSQNGKDAAHAAKLKAAEDMNLSIDELGKVHYPDARIEYEDQDGNMGRVDVEVTSDNYRSKSLQAKLSAGFKLYANGRSAKRQLSNFLGQKEPKSGSRGGGSNRDEELFEL